jgi:hypothetical protein
MEDLEGWKIGSPQGPMQNFEGRFRLGDVVAKIVSRA